ncbi:unnamed protein product [Acanthosepion pharaonis]|uniref:Uncharacterized protein n=1 Tax=Acanthosepion pharaonis TaxID=158019 RepID=A0A812E4R4_ACAPH|nr:unnamed protein product [Sepia pharaonis]
MSPLYFVVVVTADSGNRLAVEPQQVAAANNLSLSLICLFVPSFFNFVLFLPIFLLLLFLYTFFRTRTAKFSSHFFPPYPKIVKSHTTFTPFSHHTSRRWSIPIFCTFSFPPLFFLILLFFPLPSPRHSHLFFIPLFSRTSFSPSTLSSSFFTCAYPIHNCLLRLGDKTDQTEVTAAIIQVWITAGDLCLQI